MIDSSLLEPLLFIDEPSVEEENKFITFLNRLEGWKTKCKNLHWSAQKRNAHKYLDDFGTVLSTYQDGLAEGVMGIEGRFQPNMLNGIPCDCINASYLIEEVRSCTLNFYEILPQDTMYKGIVSECETFIQELNKYKYLFELCDVEVY